jgi:hypothetical protein
MSVAPSTKLCRVESAVIIAGHFGSLRRPSLEERLRGEKWEGHPLSLELQLLGPQGRSVKATRENRSTYLSPSASSLVLGDSDELNRRWSRRLSEPNDPAVGSSHLSVWATELVILDEGSDRQGALLILHLSVLRPSELSPAAVLGLIRSAGPDSVSSQSVLTDFVEDSLNGRPDRFRFSLFTFSEMPSEALYPDAAATPPAEQWLFAGASTTVSHQLRDPNSACAYFDADDEYLTTQLEPPSRLCPSADWRMLVLRDGAAIVGCKPEFGERSPLWIDDDSASSEGLFMDYLNLYHRSIYLDALVLGVIQKRKMNELLRFATAELMATTSTMEAAQGVELSVSRFRERLWWNEAAHAGEGNDMLIAYQVQHQLASRLDRIQEEVSLLSQRLSQTQQQRVGGILAFVSLAAFPLSLGLTVAQMMSPSDPTTEQRVLLVLIGFGIGAAVSFASLVLFPAMRDALRALRVSDPKGPLI